MNTVTEIIQTLRQKHYIHDFLVENGKITCKETNETFDPEELIIQRTYRYEGDSNPDDMAIIYGIVAKSGTLGILMDAYGTYANPKISELVKQIPVRELEESGSVK